MNEQNYTQRLLQVACHVGRVCAIVLVAYCPKSLGVEKSLPDPGYHCLASAIYYEARGEPLKGQRAVLDVIVNRAYKSGKNFCEVVLEKGQFQWTKRKPMLYNQASLLDEVGQHPRILRNEIYFFNASLRPAWSGKMKCRKIGNHKFCKE
jgi:hypothetical protein